MTATGQFIKSKAQFKTLLKRLIKQTKNDAQWIFHQVISQRKINTLWFRFAFSHSTHSDTQRKKHGDFFALPRPVPHQGNCGHLGQHQHRPQVWWPSHIYGDIYSKKSHAPWAPVAIWCKKLSHKSKNGTIKQKDLIHFSTMNHALSSTEASVSTTGAPALGFIKALLIVVAFDEPVRVSKWLSDILTNHTI